MKWEWFNEFLNFLHTKNNIFIYGAGGRGQYLTKELNDCGVKITAYIVTKAGDQTEKDIPVLEVKDIISKFDNYIVIISNQLNTDQREIIRNLKSNGINDYILPDETIWYGLRSRHFNRVAVSKMPIINRKNNKLSVGFLSPGI